MNYRKYYNIDVVNGPGTRCTLFVCGCEHHCEGCYNQSTWDPNSGELFTDTLETLIINDLNDTRIHRRGLSISGGDPLYTSNLEAIKHLVMRVKKECPNKDIWMWTGYKWEDLTENQREILPYIDVLIDGKYEKDLHSRLLKYRGSSNQRVIDIHKSLEGGDIILWK